MILSTTLGIALCSVILYIVCTNFWGEKKKIQYKYELTNANTSDGEDHLIGVAIANHVKTYFVYVRNKDNNIITIQVPASQAIIIEDANKTPTISWTEQYRKPIGFIPIAIFKGQSQEYKIVIPPKSVKPHNPNN